MLAAGISVGKLDLYVAAGGFHPSRVMPVVVDVGTDNETLLNEPLYMGLKRKRMRGREFVELMDEIVTALTQRYPTAVLQFEDFAIDRAKPLLERYRYDHLVFNDDIQVCFIIFGEKKSVFADSQPKSFGKKICE
jgi:malic enzyme